MPQILYSVGKIWYEMYLLWIEVHSARALSRNQACRPHIRGETVTDALVHVKSLRRHIRDRAHTRHSKRSVHLFDDAEVRYLDCDRPLVVVTQDVSRLQVAVDNALVVEIAYM